MSPFAITDRDDAAHFTLSALQALSAGRFPQWWANVWLNDETAAHGADRPWLEANGQRLHDALRADPSTREDQLQTLAGDLAMEIWGGPNRQAAEFFLVHVVADMQRRAAQERTMSGRLPDSNQARAFGGAVAALRDAQNSRPSAGDLQHVAERVRLALAGEGIGITDILRAINDHTQTVALAEWLADAPTTH